MHSVLVEVYVQLKKQNNVATFIIRRSFLLYCTTCAWPQAPSLARSPPSTWNLPTTAQQAPSPCSRCSSCPVPCRGGSRRAASPCGSVSTSILYRLRSTSSLPSPDSASYRSGSVPSQEISPSGKGWFEYKRISNTSCTNSILFQE